MSRLGKRGSVKYPAECGTKGIYKYYTKRFKGKTDSKFVDNYEDLMLKQKDVNIIARDILKYHIDRILNHSETAKLPYNLGEIRVQKKKIFFGIAIKDHKYLKTDWGHFQKTGEIKKHLNEHRNNHRYRFYWLCKKGPVGKNAYKFVSLRKNNRALKTILNETSKDYFE